eukprot:scaffold67481_cov57-Phaeocystis_antarctica.AAC.4
MPSCAATAVLVQEAATWLGRVCNSLAEKGVLLPPGTLISGPNSTAQGIELESNWEFVSMMPEV